MPKLIDEIKNASQQSFGGKKKLLQLIQQGYSKTPGDLEVRSTDENGNTPLIFLLSIGWTDAANELLERKGLEVNQHNQAGYDAIEVAYDRFKKLSLEEKAPYAQIIGKLLKQSATEAIDIRYRDRSAQLFNHMANDKALTAGFGKEKDSLQAILHQKNAELGSVEAMCQVADDYVHNRIPNGDISNATKWMKMALQTAREQKSDAESINATIFKIGTYLDNSITAIEGQINISKTLRGATATDKDISDRKKNQAVLESLLLVFTETLLDRRSQKLYNFDRAYECYKKITGKINPADKPYLAAMLGKVKLEGLFREEKNGTEAVAYFTQALVETDPQLKAETYLLLAEAHKLANPQDLTPVVNAIGEAFKITSTIKVEALVKRCEQMLSTLVSTNTTTDAPQIQKILGDCHRYYAMEVNHYNPNKAKENWKAAIAAYQAAKDNNSLLEARYHYATRLRSDGLAQASTTSTSSSSVASPVKDTILQEAFKLFTETAAQGHLGSQQEVALAYAKGWHNGGTKGDPQAALENYKTVIAMALQQQNYDVAIEAIQASISLPETLHREDARKIIKSINDNILAFFEGLKKINSRQPLEPKIEATTKTEANAETKTEAKHVDAGTIESKRDEKSTPETKDEKTTLPTSTHTEKTSAPAKPLESSAVLQAVLTTTELDKVHGLLTRLIEIAKKPIAALPETGIGRELRSAYALSDQKDQNQEKLISEETLVNALQAALSIAPNDLKLNYLASGFYSDKPKYASYAVKCNAILLQSNSISENRRGIIVTQLKTITEQQGVAKNEAATLLEEESTRSLQNEIKNIAADKNQFSSDSETWLKRASKHSKQIIAVLFENLDRLTNENQDLSLTDTNTAMLLKLLRVPELKDEIYEKLIKAKDDIKAKANTANDLKALQNCVVTTLSILEGCAEIKGNDASQKTLLYQEMLALIKTTEENAIKIPGGRDLLPRLARYWEIAIDRLRAIKTETKQAQEIADILILEYATRAQQTQFDEHKINKIANTRETVASKSIKGLIELIESSFDNNKADDIAKAKKSLNTLAALITNKNISPTTQKAARIQSIDLLSTIRPTRHSEAVSIKYHAALPMLTALLSKRSDMTTQISSDGRDKVELLETTINRLRNYIKLTTEWLKTGSGTPDQQTQATSFVEAYKIFEYELLKSSHQRLRNCIKKLSALSDSINDQYKDVEFKDEISALTVQIAGLSQSGLTPKTCAYAKLVLADIYVYQKKNEQAVKLFAELALTGDVDAISRLAEHYQSIEGAKKPVGRALLFAALNAVLNTDENARTTSRKYLAADHSIFGRFIENTKLENLANFLINFVDTTEKKFSKIRKHGTITNPLAELYQAFNQHHAKYDRESAANSSAKEKMENAINRFLSEDAKLDPNEIKSYFESNIANARLASATDIKKEHKETKTSATKTKVGPASQATLEVKATTAETKEAPLKTKEIETKETEAEKVQHAEKIIKSWHNIYTEQWERSVAKYPEHVINLLAEKLAAVVTSNSSTWELFDHIKMLVILIPNYPQATEALIKIKNQFLQIVDTTSDLAILSHASNRALSILEDVASVLDKRGDPRVVDLYQEMLRVANSSNQKAKQLTTTANPPSLESKGKAPASPSPLALFEEQLAYKRSFALTGLKNSVNKHIKGTEADKLVAEILIPEYAAKNDSRSIDQLCNIVSTYDNNESKTETGIIKIKALNALLSLLNSKQTGDQAKQTRKQICKLISNFDFSKLTLQTLPSMLALATRLLTDRETIANYHELSVTHENQKFEIGISTLHNKVKQFVTDEKESPETITLDARTKFEEKLLESTSNRYTSCYKLKAGDSLYARAYQPELDRLKAQIVDIAKNGSTLEVRDSAKFQLAKIEFNSNKANGLKQYIGLAIHGHVEAIAELANHYRNQTEHVGRALLFAGLNSALNPSAWARNDSSKYIKSTIKTLSEKSDSVKNKQLLNLAKFLLDFSKNNAGLFEKGLATKASASNPFFTLYSWLNAFSPKEGVDIALVKKKMDKTLLTRILHEDGGISKERAQEIFDKDSHETPAMTTTVKDEKESVHAQESKTINPEPASKIADLTLKLTNLVTTERDLFSPAFSAAVWSLAEFAAISNDAFETLMKAKEKIIATTSESKNLDPKQNNNTLAILNILRATTHNLVKTNDPRAVNLYEQMLKISEESLSAFKQPISREPPHIQHQKQILDFYRTSARHALKTSSAELAEQKDMDWATSPARSKFFEEHAKLLSTTTEATTTPIASAANTTQVTTVISTEPKMTPKGPEMTSIPAPEVTSANEVKEPPIEEAEVKNQTKPKSSQDEGVVETEEATKEADMENMDKSNILHTNQAAKTAQPPTSEAKNLAEHSAVFSHPPKATASTAAKDKDKKEATKGTAKDSEQPAAPAKPPKKKLVFGS